MVMVVVVVVVVVVTTTAGFIRFMQGYYMLLISRKSKVGAIGSHFVYSIDDTIYVPIPHPSYKLNNNPNEEMRYRSIARPPFFCAFHPTCRYFDSNIAWCCVRTNSYKGLFFGMDVTKFYFSYTYDITHTLQHNMTCRWYRSHLTRHDQRHGTHATGV
jgi:hypothetical protein